ncbi:hypothetical protein PSHT_03797, partial [Puccinia striiformis]
PVPSAARISHCIRPLSAAFSILTCSSRCPNNVPVCRSMVFNHRAPLPYSSRSTAQLLLPFVTTAPPTILICTLTSSANTDSNAVTSSLPLSPETVTAVVTEQGLRGWREPGWWRGEIHCSKHHFRKQRASQCEVEGHTLLRGRLANWMTSQLRSFTSEDRELTGPELVELGPVKATGERYWQVIGDHEHQGIQTNAVRVFFVISVNDLDVPSNTRFKLGTRIFLTGSSHGAWQRVKEPSQW